jgi:hypothetical protein
VRTEEGKLYLFVVIDRTSKLAYAELHAYSDRMVAIAFLQALIKAVPYKVHTIPRTTAVSSVMPPLLYRPHRSVAFASP